MKGILDESEPLVVPFNTSVGEGIGGDTVVVHDTSGDTDPLVVSFAPKMLDLPPMAPLTKPTEGYRFFKVSDPQIDLETREFQGVQLAPLTRKNKFQYPIQPAECPNYGRTMRVCSQLHDDQWNGRCSCGYYAFKTLDEAIKNTEAEYNGGYQSLVMAHTLMWGVVRHHTDGYRAERMHIVAFYEGSHPMAKELAVRYQCGLYPREVYWELKSKQNYEAIDEKALQEVKRQEQLASGSGYTRLSDFWYSESVSWEYKRVKYSGRVSSLGRRRVVVMTDDGRRKFYIPPELLTKIKE